MKNAGFEFGAPVLVIAIACALVTTGVAHGGTTANDGGQIDAGTDARAVGTLAPEVIQRVVRANFSRFKTCYSAALRQKPDLSGRVVTAFMIEPNGRVSNAHEGGGSDLPALIFTPST